ncbi:glutamate--tRNA ligase [Candidatus Woesearchaeota archaeon]|nr:glutamate--tRNA ligase [Candidatus Woesearchaeota archaeon]
MKSSRKKENNTTKNRIARKEDTSAMQKTILKFALKNAADFSGKVNKNVVLGQTLRERPEFKKEVPFLIKEIENVVKKVEALTVEQIQKKLLTIAPELLQQKEEVLPGPLKPLPNATIGKVVVRIAPSPSGPLHIGHAYGVALNHEYAKMYGGKLLLRIEDTNPENIYPPAYELIERDAQWLTGNGVAQVIVQSSRLGIYYDYAEKLVAVGKAYVCTCNADEWRDMKNKGTPCSCRSLTQKEQLLRYAKMFNNYAEGEAILRLKTNIKDKNPAMRDFGILRIVEHVHPKMGKEQRVWPLMVYSVAIDDHELGVTHVLNGKDHADNAIKEKMIMEYLGWKSPEYKHWGRINFDGFELSTSKTKIAIERKQYQDWEDIRLPFLPALRRRGYQAIAFHRFALEMGLSLNDKTVTMEEFWKSINSFNRELIEPKAYRYFFIDKPKEIMIKSLVKKEVFINLHPDFPEQGKRLLHVNGKFFISTEDSLDLAAKRIHRLMDCCNFKVDKVGFSFASADYKEYKNAENKGKIIHWLPVNETIDGEILMPDGTTLQGKGEKNMQSLNEGDIIQLERMFFARVDKKEKNKISLWYLHQ